MGRVAADPSTTVGYIKRVPGWSLPYFLNLREFVEMLSTPRIGWKPLADLCRRMGTAHSAGIDIRRVLERESQTGRPFHRRQMQSVREGVDRGDSLTASVKATDDYFPMFFREMLNIGEQTGGLDRVLPKLAEYYEHLVKMRTVFLLGISWPLLQLGAAIVIVGILILALGWVAGVTGQKSDVLGFGLVGVPGFVRYLTALGLLAALALLAWHFLSRGPLARKVLPWIMRTPGLGRTLRFMSLSQIAWAIGLSIDSGADARRSLTMALNSTANDFYVQHVPEVRKQIQAGREMYATLQDTGAFPNDFVDALEVGEESGRVTETMLRMAESYQQQAQSSLSGAAMLATMLVWGSVGGILIFLIFRIYGFYLSQLQI